MGWNGSQNAASRVDVARSPTVPQRKIKSAIWIGTAALIAVIGFAVVYLLQESGGPAAEKPVPTQKSAQIAEVAPTVVKTQQVEKALSEAERIFNETNGMSAGRLRQWEFKNWKGPILTNGVNRAKTLPEIAFENGADRQIANLLLVQPGVTMLGDSKALYNKRFLDKFKKSLVEPIIIAKDDPDEVKELKRAVIDTKIELKNRMDAGEDPCKILADTRDELKQLSLYRQELQAMVRKEVETGELSDQQIDDYIKAANTMLRDRGAKELSMPGLHARALRIRQQNGNRQ